MELCLPLKKLEHAPIQWNSAEVKLERKQFTEWMVHVGSQLHLLYIDETGFNIWILRSRGIPAVKWTEHHRCLGRLATLWTRSFEHWWNDKREIC